MGREWTGNSKATWSTVGASNHSNHERQLEDFYATHPSVADELLKRETFSNTIWEPACGQGHISKQLEAAGYKVISTDLYDRGYGTPGVDFLLQGNAPDNVDIVTNPPYKYALQFARHGYGLLRDGSKMALLLRLQFLEGKERYLFYRAAPPRTVYVFSYRAKCGINGVFDDKASAVCYAWFIWQKGYRGDPVIKWIY
jgi:hypothetical protein